MTEATSPPALKYHEAVQSLAGQTAPLRHVAGAAGVCFVSIAALTIYDMCKAVDNKMVISDIKLETKIKNEI